MDRHVCLGFDLQRKSHVNLLPHLEISLRGGVKGTKRKRKKRLERKRGGGEMDNQQIESFQINQRCKVNRESYPFNELTERFKDHLHIMIVPFQQFPPFFLYYDL